MFFIAWIGSVFCDNQCFTSVFTDCARSTLGFEDSDDTPTLCKHLKKQFDCLSEKAVICRMGFSKEAQKVSEILKQMCTKGNTINAEFERQKKCFKTAVDERKCHDPMDKILGTGETLKEMIRSNKEACKQLDSYSRCIVSSVETKCGRSNKNFFSSLFDPMMKFGQAVCDQLVTPADENTNEPRNVALISPIAIIPSFFIYA
ncbi:unnamed protein product [Larinioides sclopetarius]|uniref:DUF19 domain-containing protein n=1 Tax=Larinioides sclopetarius TaxID=280406 RepID=A0AAV2A9F2_9ARAC